MAVHKRGDVWHVRFRYFDPKTEQHRRFSRSCGIGVTRSQALELEAQWRLEVLRPPAPAPEKAAVKRAAFSGFAAHFLRTHAKAHCKPSTIRAYQRACRLYLVPAFGDRDLRVIGPEHVAELQAEMKQAGKSPKTINNTIGVLSTLYGQAVKWGYAEENPAAKVDALAIPPHRTTWYDRAQTAKFLRVCAKVRPQWHALFATALRTGLRQGEIAALEWGDLDLGSNPRVHVRRAVTEGHVGSPKSGHARIVPLPSDLVPILEAHPRRLGTDLVFPGVDGGHLTNSCCWKRLRTVQRMAGMPKTSFHDLRHSYASQLATAGVPLGAIQAYLGHADIETTMRYAHLCPTAQDGYVERLVPPAV